MRKFQIVANVTGSLSIVKLVHAKKRGGRKPGLPDFVG